MITRGDMDERQRPDDLDLMFFYAGSLLGFSTTPRCPVDDREWIERASMVMLRVARTLTDKRNKQKDWND